MTGRAILTAATRAGCNAALLAFLLYAGTVGAQVLIEPVVVELAPKQRVAALTVSVSAQAAAAVRLQLQVLRWSQGMHGEAVTEPSTDLLVSPAISEIRPGQKQLFRIALRGARPSEGELAYRLVLDDIAEPAAAAQGDGSNASANINVRMRYDLPVMVAPAVAVTERLQWHPCPGDAGTAEACVRLRNAGNRRVKMQTLVLGGDGWSQDFPVTPAINVLAGAEREWRVPLAAGHAGPVRTLQVLTSQSRQIAAEPGG